MTSSEAPTAQHTVPSVPSVSDYIMGLSDEEAEWELGFRPDVFYNKFFEQRRTT